MRILVVEDDAVLRSVMTKCLHEAGHRVDAAQRLAEAEQDGVLAGVPLERWYPELPHCFLVAVTEKRTQHDIERLVTSLSTSLAGATPARSTAHA